MKQLNIFSVVVIGLDFVTSFVAACCRLPTPGINHFCNESDFYQNSGMCLIHLKKVVEWICKNVVMTRVQIFAIKTVSQIIKSL